MTQLLVAAPSADHALAPIENAFSTLDPIDLDSVIRKAGLQDRVDTKFIATPEQMVDFVARMHHQLEVLTIDGQHTFNYDSIYFDSPGLDTYRDHLKGRRRRYKIRTRTYLDTGLKVLEIKTKGHRGRTEKVRIEHHCNADELDARSQEFIVSTLESYGICEAQQIVAKLQPTLRTSYSRATLVGRYRPFRLTVDSRLGCATESNSTSALGDRVLVEAKTPQMHDEIITALGHSGIRKVTMSKYCAGIGMLEEVPSQPWNSVIKRHLQPRI